VLGGRSGAFSVLELFPLKKGVHSLLARLCQHGRELMSPRASRRCPFHTMKIVVCSVSAVSSQQPVTGELCVSQVWCPSDYSFFCCVSFAFARKQIPINTGFLSSF